MLHKCFTVYYRLLNPVLLLSLISGMHFESTHFKLTV